MKDSELDSKQDNGMSEIEKKNLELMERERARDL
jgi:hypothetical protein